MSFLDDALDVVTTPAKWVGNAAKTAGKAAGTAIDAVDKVSGEIGDAIGSVPVVGDALEATYNLAFGTPFQLVSNVANGKRIDKAVISNLKATIKDARTVGPYAQAVISMVPGAGSGVSGMIGAGMALADGKPIDAAIMAGVQDAVPGGPAARAAFVVAKGAIEGDKIDEIAVDALPVSDNERKLIKSALKVTEAAIKGDRVDTIAIREGIEHFDVFTKAKIALAGDAMADVFIDESFKNLPLDVGDAIKVGSAIGTAIDIQKKLASVGIELKGELVTQGESLLGNPVYRGAYELLSSEDKKGYLVGLGLMSHSNLTEAYITSIRESLLPEEQNGFDIAVSAWIGQTAYPAPKLRTAPAKTDAPKLRTAPAYLKYRAGYFTTLGMRGATETQKADMLTVLSADAESEDGIYAALQALNEMKQQTWWSKFIDFVTFWN